VVLKVLCKSYKRKRKSEKNKKKEEKKGKEEVDRAAHSGPTDMAHPVFLKHFPLPPDMQDAWVSIVFNPRRLLLHDTVTTSPSPPFLSSQKPPPRRSLFFPCFPSSISPISPLESSHQFV
jgi:hypothetical protein